MDSGAGAREVESRVAALAARQHGVVTRAQLIRAGLRPGAVDARVRAGRLRLLHRGVYVPGGLVGPLLPPRHTEMAAVLACGPGATVSHDNAGALWAIRPPRPSGRPPQVTVAGRRPRRTGIEVHRVAVLPPEDRTVIDGIPITTPARTILDLAARLRARDLEQAIARAERLDLTDSRELLALLERSGPRTGAPLLRSILDGLAEGTDRAALTRSVAEERLLALVRRARLPAPEVNARFGDYELDFLWPGAGVAVEVDGFAFHSTPMPFDRDRERDAELAARGIQVIRVTWRHLTQQPDAVLGRLARVLGRAEATRGLQGVGRRA